MKRKKYVRTIYKDQQRPRYDSYQRQIHHGEQTGMSSWAHPWPEANPFSTEKTLRPKKKKRTSYRRVYFDQR